MKIFYSFFLLSCLSQSRSREISSDRNLSQESTIDNFFLNSYLDFNEDNQSFFYHSLYFVAESLDQNDPITKNIHAITRTYSITRKNIPYPNHPYFPASLLKTAPSLEQDVYFFGDSPRQYFTHKELLKIKSYRNTTYVFFLNGNEGDEFQKFLKHFNKLRREDATYNSFGLNSRKYTCVIMNSLANTQYTTSDDSYCTGLANIHMKKNTSGYNSNDPDIQADVIEKISRLMNPDPPSKWRAKEDVIQYDVKMLSFTTIEKFNIDKYKQDLYSKLKN